MAFEEHLGFDISNEDADNNIKSFDDAVHIFSKELQRKNNELNKKE